MCPPSPPTCPPMSLYSPATSRRLYGLLWPPGGYFAPMSGRAEHVPKRKTAVKAIFSPVTAFYTLVAIPIFPHRKTAHSGRQRPAQGIKQPRPTPLWSRPGRYYLLRASESTAQRSAVWSYQAQEPPLHFTMSRHTSARPLDAPMATTRAKSISGHSRWCSKSSAIVVSPLESRRHSRLIAADP